ncbi:cysteine desulfurase [bacterium]|nr:cysteine desulfurase [bacterium]
MNPYGETAAIKAIDAHALSIDDIRAEFPVLNQRIRGKRLVYLDNAASAQKPRAVMEAMDRLMREDYANIHRGVHTLSQRSTRAYEDARGKVRRFLGAARDEEIVFVRGTTEGINLVAHSFVRPRLSEGDEILVTHMEHHSNIVPWQILCEQTGARLVVAPINDAGELEMDAFEKLIGPRTKFVSVVHVSNALGTINPVARIVELAKARDIPVMLDGAQAAPHTRVDVRALGCDFYVFSSHKLYGPTGVGVLYGRHERLADMPPYQGGGDMIASVSFTEGTTYAKPPARFEAGTPNIVGVVGLGAAIDWVNAIGIDAIEAWEHELVSFATQEVARIPGVRLVGTAREKAGVVSFLIDGVHPHDVGTILDQEGVAVRAGHHCAQPVMERFGVPATARASFAVYNTFEEVDALLAGILKVREVFG